MEFEPGLTGPKAHNSDPLPALLHQVCTQFTSMEGESSSNFISWAKQPKAAPS